MPNSLPHAVPNARPNTVPRRRDFINLGFDPLSRSGIVDAILGADAGARFRYVVTPNVDHMVRIDADPEVAALYRDAWLCLNDSRILSALARLARVDLPATPGSDLVVDLLNDPRLARDTPILVVGGEPGLARQLRMLLGLTAVAQYRPPMNLLRDAAAMRATVEAVEASGAALVFLAVGSPQQERVAAGLAARGKATGIGLCSGAGLEFLVGARQRAPRWMQRAGLEWAFRLASEPRRLARRYLVVGPRIVTIFLSYLVARRANLQQG